MQESVWLKAIASISWRSVYWTRASLPWFFRFLFFFLFRLFVVFIFTIALAKHNNKNGEKTTIDYLSKWKLPKGNHVDYWSTETHCRSFWKSVDLVKCVQYNAVHSQANTLLNLQNHFYDRMAIEMHQFIEFYIHI